MKVVGQLSDIELANALADRKKELENDKSGIKDRNILRGELLKAEKDRFLCYQAMVDEWAKKHTMFRNDVEDVRHHMNMLHETIRTKLDELPVNKLEQTKVIVAMEKLIDENNDVIEDKMFNIEAKELLKAQEDAKKLRTLRNTKRDTESSKKMQDAEEADSAFNQKIMDDIQKERTEKARKEYKLQQKAEKKAQSAPAPVAAPQPAPESSKKKDDALNTIVADNEMIMNVAGVNSNLLSFSSKVADLVRTKKMTHAYIARAKDGSLVIVCSKAGMDKENKENVRIVYRDGRYSCSIANNTFCKYIRAQYGCNDTDEYHFTIKYVAYADDIKIKIESINN